jgi:hypothetical protein
MLKAELEKTRMLAATDKVAIKVSALLFFLT